MKTELFLWLMQQPNKDLTMSIFELKHETLAQDLAYVESLWLHTGTPLTRDEWLVLAVSARDTGDALLQFMCLLWSGTYIVPDGLVVRPYVTSAGIIGLKYGATPIAHQRLLKAEDGRLAELQKAPPRTSLTSHYRQTQEHR